MAPRNAAVQVTVSRGLKLSRPQSDDGGGGTSGYTPTPWSGYSPTPGFGTAQPGGTIPGGNTSSPTLVPSVTGSEAGDGSGGGSPEGSNAGEVVSSSFSPPGESSPLRRMLGLALLGGSFLAAGAAAVRAGRRRPGTPSSNGLEPIVFWDERLLQAVRATIRRATGRL